jgi:hypothetical protein
LFLQGDQYNKVPTFSLNSICKFLFFQINKSYDQLCREELSLRVNIFISKNYEAKLVLNPFMSIYMQLWVYLSPFTSSEKQSCLGGCKWPSGCATGYNSSFNRYVIRKQNMFC